MNHFLHALYESRERLIDMSNRKVGPIDRAETLDALGLADMLVKIPLKAIAPLQESVQLRGPAAPSLRLATSLQLLGWAQVSAGQPAPAVASLQRSLAMRTALDPNGPGTADSLLLLAESARQAGTTDVVIDSRQKLVQLARTGAKEVNLASALDDLGLTLILAERSAEAVPLLQEAVTIRRPGGANEALGTSLHNLGWSMSSSNRAKQAIEPLEEAVKIRSVLSSPQLVDSLRFLGYAYWGSNTPGPSVGVFERVLKVAQTKSDRRALAQSYNDVALALLLATRYEEAIAPAQQAVQLLTAEGVTGDDLGNALHNLGWSMFSGGRTPDSIEPLQRAVAIRAKTGSANLADSRTMLESAQQQVAQS